VSLLYTFQACVDVAVTNEVLRCNAEGLSLVLLCSWMPSEIE